MTQWSSLTGKFIECGLLDREYHTPCIVGYNDKSQAGLTGHRGPPNAGWEATMNRRESLKLIAGATALISLGGGRAWAQTPPPPTGPFTLPPLGYAFDALEPHIDAQTMTLHHDRHHAANVNNANQLVPRW